MSGEVPFGDVQVNGRKVVKTKEGAEIPEEKQPAFVEIVFDEKMSVKLPDGNRSLALEVGSAEEIGARLIEVAQLAKAAGYVLARIKPPTTVH